MKYNAEIGERKSLLLCKSFGEKADKQNNKLEEQQKNGAYDEERYRIQ